MSTLTVNKLTPSMGAEITGVDLDRLLHDDAMPELIRQGLREHGVLLFHDLGFTPQTQVTFSERLGQLDRSSGEEHNEPGIMRVSMDPNKNGGQETVRGTFNWHMDGCTLPPGRNPSPATVLTCVEVSETGGQTEFASTRALFASLTAQEQERLTTLRVVHSVAGSRRRVIANSTPEQEAEWARMGVREHPLVWRHRQGRPSLVIGGTSDYLVGMDKEESRVLLDELVDRATTADRVYRHEWSIGDTVIWDNPGMLHRVEPYEDGSNREMIRCTLIGEEPTE
ncbi:MAG: TauD/TfdA family dioxygenase [Rhodococcus sp. (in: high G+C Gram-positive bacteria)]|nr:MAG: TauD/TfdA family dioxygenase [Rhodococcus sp. (in: high G+C Gram-positive bacteria)]